MRRLSTAGSAGLISRLTAGDLAALSDAERVKPRDRSYLRFDLARCPGCSESNFLSVREVTVKEEKGKETEEAKAVVRLLRIRAEQVELVRKAGRPPEGLPPKDAAPSA